MSENVDELKKKVRQAAAELAERLCEKRLFRPVGAEPEKCDDAHEQGSLGGAVCPYFPDQKADFLPGGLRDL